MLNEADLSVATNNEIVKRQGGRWFYVGLTLFLIVLNIVAFAPAIISPATRRVPLPLTGLVLLHAILATAWMLLFLAQVTLVATGRVALHRRLGICVALLSVAFVITGCVTIIEQTRRGFDLSGDLTPPDTPVSAAFILAPVNAFVLFVLLVAAALWYRKRPAIHKRLMMLAMLGPMMGAPIAHIIGHWPVLHPYAGPLAPVIGLALMSALAIHDRWSQGRIHPVSLWGALGIFVWFGVFFGAIAQSSAWQHFAAWVIR
jgi:hypothetical protein